MATPRAKGILRKFQSDYMRESEESFARAFSERENVRVYFSNEGQSFTDGRNIILDPSMNMIFENREYVRKAESRLNLPNLISSDTWNILKVITRALNIHECLHLLYSDMPPKASEDDSLESENERMILNLINNIIEDSYIENVGATVYDNINFYLKILRLSIYYSVNRSEGEMKADTLFDWQEELERNPEQQKEYLLKKTLGYITDVLLYPFGDYGEPDEDIKEYVKRVKEPFFEASMTASPSERYLASKEILKSLRELVPKDTMKESGLSETLSRKLAGSSTHVKNMRRTKSYGKEMKVDRRLFEELGGKDGSSGNEENDLEKMIEIIETIKSERNFLDNSTKSAKRIKITDSEEYRGAVNHRGVKVRETRPEINYSNREEYRKILSHYSSSINSYTARFTDLLRTVTMTRDDRRFFGRGIDSRRLSDSKKRYWYSETPELDVPELSVLLLIDGSGSMIGKKTRYTVLSSVILHEVLFRQGIPHAICEHRGDLKKDDIINVNVLYDFNASNDYRYNILNVKAQSDNRDGLALLWAERYITKHTSEENRLIIVLSDGLPFHTYEDYYPMKSVTDTKKIVEDIKKRGTNVIGIALDEKSFGDTLELMKEIYPDLIICRDLKKLTGQILSLVTRQIES